MRVLLVLLLLAAPARADDHVVNYLGGPVFGLSWERLTGAEQVAHGKYRRHGLFVGLEGGIGVWFERLNVGVSNRGGEPFGYVELDPWAGLGVSGGVGYGLDSGFQPIAGLWEGFPWPLEDGGCDDTELLRTLTVSFGVRWTGVLELYVSPKIGLVPDICQSDE